MIRVVAIVGPTAAGKTALAMRLAEAAGGEIVSVDSQQVYRGMDIGTGKANLEEQRRVRHHLLDVAAPDEPMTAARFVGLADAAIREIHDRGAPVLLAGGTGLYYRALMYGLFQGPPVDPDLRRRLEQEPTAALRARLETADPTTASRLHPADRFRIIRALEVFEQTGVTMSQHQARHDHHRVPLRYDVRAVGLAPSRPELYRRIDRRVDEMIAAGLVEEVRRLGTAGYGSDLRALQAIGYREIGAHLRGEMTLDEAALLIKRATHRFARRQVSWFRSEPTVSWVETSDHVDMPSLLTWLRPAT